MKKAIPAIILLMCIGGVIAYSLTTTEAVTYVAPTSITKSNTFEENVDEYMEQVNNVVQAIYAKKQTMESLRAEMQQAEANYQATADKYNQAVREYNALLDGTSEATPAALAIYSHVGETQGLFATTTDDNEI